MPTGPRKAPTRWDHPGNDGVWVASLLAMTALWFQTQLHDLAARCARGLHLSSAPNEGVGNAGCPLHPRPRVRFVVVRSTRVTTSTPESPGIPARNGFNGFLRALPGDRALCHRRPRTNVVSEARLGRHNIRELDASVGASGPHDFAVRWQRLSSACSSIAHRSFDPPCNPVARKTLPRPPHPHPASVTIAIRPCSGVGREKF
jgi:hypothetical protein